MTDRQLLTMEELGAWFTDQIVKREDCEGTRVSVRYKLAQPDAEGVNWSELTFFPGPRAASEEISDLLQLLIAEARKRFNVK